MEQSEAQNYVQRILVFLVQIIHQNLFLSSFFLFFNKLHNHMLKRKHFCNETNVWTIASKIQAMKHFKVLWNSYSKASMKQPT